MDASLDRVLKLEVPIVVLIGQRRTTVAESLMLAPGVIIEIPKSVDDDLELLVNNKVVATGKAVKVGENFGIQLNYVGDLRERVRAMGEPQEPGDGAQDADIEALAAQLLAEQA